MGSDAALVDSRVRSLVIDAWLNAGMGRAAALFESLVEHYNITVPRVLQLRISIRDAATAATLTCCNYAPRKAAT